MRQRSKRWLYDRAAGRTCRLPPYPLVPRCKRDYTSDEVCVFDVFVLHAPADAAFVRGYLLPALNLPPARVALVDELLPGELILAEIERCIAESRFALVILTPALLADRW